MNFKHQAKVKEAKGNLRKVAAARRAAMGPVDRAEASVRAWENFLEEVDIVSDAKIALYWPMGHELDCRGLIACLLERDVSVCLPTIVGQGQPLGFRQYRGADNLVPAGLGTQEPPLSAPIIVPDIVVLPLLAFDRQGNRLGYGGGFYDRTIAGMTNRPLLTGLAFAVQLHDSVPIDQHDERLDLAVTETGVFRFN
ncbi:MAG TPA: 5-formyltetrahydrofolate cyclo-ligase [Devosia sp.]|nr:5-formyltetrahydrofolate cyclo-ligase [Devosia sp.]